MIRDMSVMDLITRLNETDESEDLEAKEISGSDLGTSLYETICALSNEPDLGGGTILLGISREQELFPLYTVSGVRDPEKLSSDLTAACSSKFNQPVRLSIRTDVVGQKVVLRIDVSELPASSKPLYFKATGLPRGAFRRSGSSDVRCTDADMTAFFQGKASEPYDSQMIPDSSWADLDPSAISAYRRARSDANASAEELTWPDAEMLEALGAVQWCDGEIKATRTGILTFGTVSALRRLFPAHRVDYVRMPGNTWVADPERNFDALDMRGPIVSIIGRVIAAITDDLPKTLQVGDSQSGQRAEIPVIPVRVIREAVVNALMHRSYQVFQPIQIVRYANRLVIRNPGYSLKSDDRFEQPGSVIRNPRIAEILHETRFAETKGSGIRVMQQRMQQSGLASPAFESDRNADQFEATFLFHHFLGEEDWHWLGHFKSLDLTEDQMKALIFVREVGAIDNSTYRGLTQADTLGASKSLRRLRELNLLKDRGSGTKIHYVAGDEMIRRISLDAKGSRSAASIQAKRASLDGEASKVTLSDLPDRLRVAVRATHLSRRLDPNRARNIIEFMCSWRPLSAGEIASLLQKNAVHISQKYLGPMVAEGRLEYLYPEMPQHPSQKYQTALTLAARPKGE